MGIFESTISLSIEMIALSLLITGYLLKRQKKYRHHGLSMASGSSSCGFQLSKYVASSPMAILVWAGIIRRSYSSTT